MDLSLGTKDPSTSIEVPRPAAMDLGIALMGTAQVLEARTWALRSRGLSVGNPRMSSRFLASIDLGPGAGKLGHGQWSLGPPNIESPSMVTGVLSLALIDPAVTSRPEPDL